MYPYITIFGLQLSTYGIMAGIGLAVAFAYFLYARRRFNLPMHKVEMTILIGGVGAFLGSKILYLIIVLPSFINDFQYFDLEPDVFLQVYLGSGWVFYGGVYGAIGTIILYNHFAKLDIWEVSRLLMPCLPLFHCFGRIGCFLAGCCYGIESEQFGIAFTSSRAAPNDVPLMPVQLIEAGCEAILFMIMWQMSFKKSSGRQIFGFWLITYSAIRFVLEFIRGDEIRGYIGPLSTSQIIAIASILYGLILLYWNPENRPSFSFTNKKKRT